MYLSCEAQYFLYGDLSIGSEIIADTKSLFKFGIDMSCFISTIGAKPMLFSHIEDA